MSRWVRFNVIGIVGFLFQMVALSVLAQVTFLTSSMAVAVAVLLTVSHNFLWHEKLTWPNLPAAGRVRRWLAFQIATGLIAVVTNISLTAVIARVTGLSLVPANALAVGAASFATFFVSDRLVFRQSLSAAARDPGSTAALPMMR